MNPNIRTGTVAGTGAALNVVLGFTPDYVRVVNIEDGDTAFEWWSGMTDGHAIQTTNHDTAQLSRITSAGITPLDDADDGAGFTLGTTISEDGKDLAYIAVRNGAAG